MTTLLAFAVVLGFLVFVHELGHFLIAKLTGVKVHTFSIGFGPRILGFRRGDTDYRLSIIPLGGYVKMAGENPSEPATGAPDEFMSKSVPQRLAIIVAGPVMNLIWAVIFITVIFLSGIDEPLYLSEPVRVGWVQPNSPAAEAGLRRGDHILKIGAVEVDTWTKFLSFNDSAKTELLPITFERDGQEHRAYLEPIKNADELVGRMQSISPLTPAVIGDISPGMPAEKAGVQPGDSIVALNDQPIEDWYQLSYIIHNSAGDSMQFVVARGPEKLSFRIVPVRDETTGWGLIGITPRLPTRKVAYGFGASIRQSIGFNYQIGRLTLGYLWKVITGRQSGKDIGGPISIAKFAGDAARSGVNDLIRLMGFLSLQLGLLNLLPIPILDGGHVVLLLIEGVSGKPLNQRAREIVQIIGLVLIAGIMIFALFNDFSRLFG